MRTTVDLDDDILLAVKERARRESRTIGQVLSELARRALTTPPPGALATQGSYGFKPLPNRGPAVSNALIDRLREEEGE
jgi:hypothetical protein